LTPPDDRPPPQPAVPDASWKVLNLPVDAPPPGVFRTDEDAEDDDADRYDGEDGGGDTSAGGSAVESRESPAGPPGGRTFSLEGRPAPALYLIAWLFSVGGVAALFVTSQAAPSFARSLAVIAAIVAIGLGLSAGAGYQIVARRDRDAPWYHGPSPLLVFGVVLAISTLVSGLLAPTGLVDGAEPFGFLLGLFIVAGAYLVTVWLFAVRSGAFTWADMGWPTEGSGRLREALRGIGSGALVMIPVTFGMLVVAGITAAVLDVQAPAVVPSASTSVEALFIALAAAVVAPVGEELFFRGFALTAWARDLPDRSALMRSAAFFALVHIANINAASFREGASQALLQIVVILPIGVVLGWLFLRFGILASIAGHITYNGLLLLLLLVGPGSTGAT